MNLHPIKLIVLDVDGTLTDGGIYIDSHGAEAKKFSVRDGCGVALAQTAGVDFMILTGRESRCVAQRAEELKIKYVAQGVSRKAAYLKDFSARHGFAAEQIAYIGDDLNDLPAMRHAGVSACPADAAEEVRNRCHIILPCKGGDGAVRAFVEILLKQRNLWEKTVEKLFGEEQ
jgi:3-deoxy-D-manno-octulosonate 8-phosphate phosphatase (KDO 8-P phosphatase)